METLVTDPQGLAPFLNRDWPWAGFALGDLDPEWTPRCEWRRAADTVFLLFDGLSPRLACGFGDASGLAEILESIGEPRLWANVQPAFEEVFRHFYRLDGCSAMRRMYLDRPVAPAGDAVPLGPGDRAEIEDLLAQGEWVLFFPERLAEGHYYGVREGGRLVAIAGSHLASPRYDIGALGSVFTHPACRGRGLAAVCCSHVLASMGRAGIGRIVLNVKEEHEGARRVYERLGFQTACVYLDGVAERV